MNKIIDGGIITKTDSYKMCHWNMYPEGTQYVYSYLEARKATVCARTPLFGLQYILKRYLAGQVVFPENIEFAENLCLAHFGKGGMFNSEMWNHILKEHGGRLPIEIRAIPEGLAVPEKNVMMTVVNTDPKCFALTNAIESLLLHVWYPSTVAAVSLGVRDMFRAYLDACSDNPGAIDFMLHDFGYRGVSSDESAQIGAAAHLAMGFLGTDSLVGMETAMNYYHASMGGLGYSVPATEHSIMTSLGEEGEPEILRNLIKKYPTGILSVVADSYDIYRFVSKYVCTQFRQEILDRSGVFVVRPDSITLKHRQPEELVVWILNKLFDHFGGKVNSKGYRVLNPKVRVLWGDGIGPDGIRRILAMAKAYKFSPENLVFGMGGELLQKVNRDTQGFAFKSSAQRRDGVWYDVFKVPLDRAKASKRGHLALFEKDGRVTTIKTEPYDHTGDMLELVFKDGVILREQSFSDVRLNSQKTFQGSQPF